MLMPNRSLSTDVGRSAARAMRAALREARGGDSLVFEPFGDDRGVDVAVRGPAGEQPGRLFG
jgi:hypothetical protein